MPAGLRQAPGGPFLHRVVAGDAPSPRPRRRKARPRGRADRPRGPARHRRTRLPAARCRRGAARVPGLRRRLRAPVGGDHDEPGVLPLGIGLRGRPDGGCGHRPHRASRQARAVQRRVVPRTPRTHVGRAAQKWRAHSVRALLRFYCPFCSNLLDETHHAQAGRARGARARRERGVAQEGPHDRRDGDGARRHGAA